MVVTRTPAASERPQVAESVKGVETKASQAKPLDKTEGTSQALCSDDHVVPPNSVQNAGEHPGRDLNKSERFKVSFASLFPCLV